MMGSPMAILAAAATALLVGVTTRWIAPPPRSLRSRMQPYLSPAASITRPSPAAGTFWRVFGPIVTQAAEAAGRLLERSGDQVTVAKLRQAGWYRDVPEPEMITAYRLAQLRFIGLGVGLGVVAGQVLALSPAVRLALVGLGLVVGATRPRARVERAIEERRELMRIEIYTINQLLAMRVRTGGGVISAVQAVAARGRGEVVSELSDGLRLHRAGWSAGDAFRRIAEMTPEPFCGRTYRLLAAAEERGADLAGALLSLAEDVRESRRESIRRSATKRRAAMLVPTIAILAPVLILFVAAPLPYLITGWN
jgi:tight adherence protein C